MRRHRDDAWTDAYFLDTYGKRQTVFFDAGESCSWTAHLGGLDLLQTRAIFISHVHHDHIAGLAGLMENIRAVAWIKKALPATDNIKIYIPQQEVWDYIYQFLQYTTDGHNTAYTITAEEPKPGVFYDDGFVKVAAFETQYMKKTEDVRCRSFAYRIETEGKSCMKNRLWRSRSMPAAFRRPFPKMECGSSFKRCLCMELLIINGSLKEFCYSTNDQLCA